MSYSVSFSDVGREHAAFSAEVRELTFINLRRAIGSRLKSHDVDFEIDPDTRTGRVFVGGVRLCGTFTYTEIEPHCEPGDALKPRSP